ncbi:MAG: CsbD family protein [Acidobacteriota bacterium]
MNTDQIEGKFRQWKGAAKAQWGKLTDDELTQAQGNAEKLAGFVQERYGYAKERAREEVDRFLASQDIEDAKAAR